MPETKVVRTNLPPMIAYGVVSAQTEQVVEFFASREEAEAVIRELVEDEPELAQLLRLEPVELDGA